MGPGPEGGVRAREVGTVQNWVSGPAVGPGRRVEASTGSKRSTIGVIDRWRLVEQKDLQQQLQVGLKVPLRPRWWLHHRESAHVSWWMRELHFLFSFDGRADLKVHSPLQSLPEANGAFDPDAHGPS